VKWKLRSFVLVGQPVLLVGLLCMVGFFLKNPVQRGVRITANTHLAVRIAANTYIPRLIMPLIHIPRITLRFRHLRYIRVGFGGAHPAMLGDSAFERLVDRLGHMAGIAAYIEVRAGLEP
jgi:hypothetical protein